MPVLYEWDIESVDEHGDIQDHNHSDTLEGFSAYRVSDLRNHCLKPDCDLLTYRLVLVRDIFNKDTNSLEDRQWAYIENNRLPEEFDAGAKVPKRFFKELAKFEEKHG